MIRTMPRTLAEKLADYGQEHLLCGWDNLTPSQQHRMAAEIETIDFELLDRLFQQSRDSRETSLESPATRALRARPPAQLVRLPQTPADKEQWAAAARHGAQLLREGKVGAILVAGGSGTRLGYDLPKGMFPISPVTNRSLYQLLAEQLLARSQRAGAAIPYYIMTSEATHEPTVAFFKEHRYFGLNPADVQFFQQGTMPAIDSRTGRLLLAEPGQLANSPDGHGGILAALERAELLDDMRERGLEYLYYHQVDNPLAIVCDPAFLGFHAQRGAEVSTKVVAKTGPDEKMGVLVEIDRQTQIIEYSDLPAAVANRRTNSGELELWAGSTAMHIFDLAFLERIIRDGLDMPFHLAHKKVAYINDELDVVEPDQPNAYKFERFIFDTLPHARLALGVETAREREFNPVKNASGVNSPDDVRNSLISLHAGWLRSAGVKVPEDVPVEIHSDWALDAAEVAARVDPSLRLPAGPVYLGPTETSA